jgi:integrase
MTMGRRGNGEGTITRRKDGRWEARYYVPTMNGTKRKTIYGKTQAEVRDRLTKALSDRIDGIVYDDDNMTVGEYLDVWLKGSVYGSVRRSTYDRDTNLVNNHIKPALGGSSSRSLTPRTSRASIATGWIRDSAPRRYTRRMTSCAVASRRP